MRRLLLGLIVTALATIGFARGAAAYPQFQFSSGTNKCSQCHFSPAGTGMISSWGRSEAGDTLSMAGNGAFLHGAVTLPQWLALGGDFRLAGVRNDDGGTEAPQTAWFPMQADLYSRFAFGDAFSLYLEGGVRGEVRPSSGFSSTGIGNINYDLATVGDRFISREHYFMWRPSATGPYARIGRFFAPYGLRFVEHIFFVRRYTGYNLYEETYTASGGYVSDNWELHVSAFTPPPSSFPDALQSIGYRESGGAAYFEQRFIGEGAVSGALAVQARIGVASEEARYQGGLIGKLWIDPAKLLFLGEADFIRQQVSAASFGQDQFVAYAGLNAFPVRGVMAALMYERYQENMTVSATARNAIDAEINVFPYAHCEVVLFGRIIPAGSAGPGGAPTDQPATSLLMLQLHYYL